MLSEILVVIVRRIFVVDVCWLLSDRVKYFFMGLKYGDLMWYMIFVVWWLVGWSLKWWNCCVLFYFVIVVFSVL